MELVDEGKELRIQKAKRDAESAAIKTIKTINCDKEEEFCFVDIDEAVKDHGSKSE